MDKPFYEFTVADEACTFQFVSIGQQVIQKCVVYRSTSLPHFYNLAMGDLLPNGTLDVEVVSDNGDRDEILATVIQTLIVFLDTHPTDFVLFTGSSPARTRLYQILISHELDQAQSLFAFWGMSESGQLVSFEKNKPYIGFVVALLTNPKKL